MFSTLHPPPRPWRAWSRDMMSVIRAAVVHPSLSPSHRTAASIATASTVKELQYLPAVRESLSTSPPPSKTTTPPPPLSVPPSAAPSVNRWVGRTYLLQAGLSSLPLGIQGFSFCRLGVVEVEGEILSPWGQSDAVILLANFMLQGLKVRDAAPQSLAGYPPSLLPGSLGDPSLHQVSPDIPRVQGPPSLVLGQSCPFCSFPQCLQPRLSEHYIRRRTPHHSRNRSGCSSLSLCTLSIPSLVVLDVQGYHAGEAYSKTLGWVAEQK